MTNFPWWIVSLISAVVAMVLFALSFWLPMPWGPLCLCIGIVVFIAVLVRNPLYWYRYAAAGLLAGWVMSTIGSKVQILLQVSANSFAIFVFEGIDWPVHLITGIIIIVLLLLDYWRTRKPAKELLGASDSEFDQTLDKINKRERSKLFLQKLQQDSEFFFVDSADLEKSDAAKLAIRQVCFRERKQLGWMVLVSLFIMALTVILLRALPSDANSDAASTVLPRIRDPLPHVTTDQSGAHTVRVRWEGGNTATQISIGNCFLEDQLTLIQRNLIGRVPNYCQKTEITWTFRHHVKSTKILIGDLSLKLAVTF